MLIRTRIPWTEMLRQLWQMTMVIALYSFIVSFFVSWVDAEFHLEILRLPVGLATLPGAFVGVLLAFRTNSSYGRWWEARTLWGQIVNDSRSLVRQLIAFAADSNEHLRQDDTVRRMSHRQIAWCYVLTRSLRGEQPLSDVENMIESEEFTSLVSQHNTPNAILVKHAQDLRRLRDDDVIDTWQFVALEQTLTRLTNSMGGCERIRNTPFPPLYSTWIHYLIYLFIVMLPFALVDMPAIGLILVTVPIAVGFLIVEKVAVYLENPFSDVMSCTPMSALSRTIEINIRQMLEESELPPELLPQNGLLE